MSDSTPAFASSSGINSLPGWIVSGVLGLAVGRRWRGTAPTVGAGGPAGPGGAFVDRPGEQVVQHLVRLRDARLRDPLHCGMHSGGRGVPAEGLR